MAGFQFLYRTNYSRKWGKYINAKTCLVLSSTVLTFFFFYVKLVLQIFRQNIYNVLFFPMYQKLNTRRLTPRTLNRLISIQKEGFYFLLFRRKNKKKDNQHRKFLSFPQDKKKWRYNVKYAIPGTRGEWK